MSNNSTFFQSIELLQQVIQARTTVQPEDLEAAVQLVNFKQFGKGEVVSEIGKVENYVYFIIEGVTRSYFFKEDKEISLDFHFNGDFVSVYESFLDRIPAKHGIEALTPLSILRIRHEDLMQLYRQAPKFEQVGRIMVEELFKKSSERVKDLLSLSATERYVKLLNAQPLYVQHIPLKYLASYLHITPESLSRIRKSI